MASRLEQLIQTLRDHPKNIRFADLLKVCRSIFGEPRIAGSHHLFKTPWPGDPRVNIQNTGGKAKVYQVEQVLKAIDRLRNEKGK